MSAKGLSSRCLRARSAATAASSAARHARWKPPTPLTATIAPSRRASAAARSASSPRALAPPARVGQPQGRPAGRARVGLGVEAAVGGVLVLGAARGAHGEGAHRRALPVVGDAQHDREARPAVRAVREGVAVAAVGRVEDLGQAGVARRAVGGHERRGRPGAPAGQDLEAVLAGRGRVSARHALDGGQRRSLRAHAAHEALDRGAVALHLDHHAALVVAHPAGEARARVRGGRRAGGSRRPARRPRRARGRGGRRARPRLSSGERRRNADRTTP